MHLLAPDWLWPDSNYTKANVVVPPFGLKPEAEG
jgi:hypothetical protein